MALTWAETAVALREHPVAKTFVPVTAYRLRPQDEPTPLFPVEHRRWAQRHKLPRPREVCALYASRAIALLERHWPLERGETPDVKGLGAVALSFVIYFAERGIPEERHHEFLLAEPMFKLLNITLNQMAAKKEELTFDAARALVAKRMQHMRGNQPLVMRSFLRSVAHLGVTQQDFSLHITLHDTAHVLSACEHVLTEFKVLRVVRSGEGDKPILKATVVTDTVRVAWPGMLSIDGHLHIIAPKSPLYVCFESTVPMMRGTAPKCVSPEDTRKAIEAAAFNAAAMEVICMSDEIMHAARTHHAPPLLLAYPPPPRLVVPPAPRRGPEPPPPHEPPPPELRSRDGPPPHLWGL